MRWNAITFPRKTLPFQELFGTTIILRQHLILPLGKKSILYKEWSKKHAYIMLNAYRGLL